MKFDKQILLDGVLVGENCRPYIIAEAGVAHFGSLEKAFKLCDLAKEARADSIKFQIFNVDKLISKVSAEWKERLGPRQMSSSDYKKVKAYCDQIGLTFFATAHDEESLDELLDMSVPFLKVGSGERGNFKFLKKMIGANLPMIISTGMYTEDDIKSLVDFLFENKKKDVVILHCVTEYPANPNSINLNTINWIAENFKVITGYSDHTQGHHIAAASAALGACVIEKHISLDFDVPNAQDWKVSCGPHDLQAFVENVSEIYQSLGKAQKCVSEREVLNAEWATKGVYAARDIKANSLISEADLVLKRPANTIKPSQYVNLLGRKTNKHILADTALTWDSFYEN